jgi:large subunit ribosomal protein L33
VVKNLLSFLSSSSLSILLVVYRINFIQSPHQTEVFMAKGARENIKLKSTESDECYWTRKNKRNTTERIELKKYDKKLKKRVIFKEAK